MVEPDSALRANGMDVKMRQFSLQARLALAGLVLLVGCSEPTETVGTLRNVDDTQGEMSLRVVPPIAPGALSAQMVVAAAHQEPVLPTRVVEDEYFPAITLETPESLRRLPPVPPRVKYAPASDYPSTTDPQPAPRHLERLPNTQRPTASAQPVAVNLASQSRATPIRLLPPVVRQEPEDRKQAVPRRRAVPPPARKPPLPALASVNDVTPQVNQPQIPAPSLVAVADQVDTMTKRAFSLAEKGALFSAKAEFHQALRAISHSLDAQRGGNEFSESLALGLQALDEANDFAAHAQHGPVVDVEVIVDGHQTPLLKPYDLSTVSPVVAMQRYYNFAQQHLLKASGGAPVAARVYYGLGKLHMVLGEDSPSAERLHGPTAMAFHQVALIIDPTNHLAANELGVLLARFGKFPEARSVLQHAIALRPLPETWQNLSIVHRELGEASLAAQSLANWQFATQQVQQQNPERNTAEESMVKWVPPQEFAEPWQRQNATAASRASSAPPAQARQKAGFLWW